MGNVDLGDPLESPLNYFLEYFTDKLFELLAKQTNQYYFRVTQIELKTTPDEIRKFFGAAVIIANHRYSCLRTAWDKVSSIDKVSNAISADKFFKLHINSAAVPHPNKTNKFKKIEPLVTIVRNECLTLCREEHCSIDEK